MRGWWYVLLFLFVFRSNRYGGGGGGGGGRGGMVTSQARLENHGWPPSPFFHKVDLTAHQVNKLTVIWSFGIEIYPGYLLKYHSDHQEDQHQSDRPLKYVEKDLHKSRIVRANFRA